MGRWPELERQAAKEGRTAIWVDESASCLLPARVRTWAPRGATPIPRLPLTRDHLAAISGLTTDGRLFLRVRAAAVRGPDCVAFLRRLARQARGPLLVIWDGAPIHRSATIKDFLRTGTGRRIRLETLPGYAPELNPDEGIWQYLKRVALRNVLRSDLDHLHDELTRAAKRLRRQADIIRGCVRQVGIAL
jgi:transposase